MTARPWDDVQAFTEEVEDVAAEVARTGTLPLARILALFDGASELVPRMDAGSPVAWLAAGAVLDADRTLADAVRSWLAANGCAGEGREAIDIADAVGEVVGAVTRIAELATAVDAVAIEVEAALGDQEPEP